MKKPKIITPAIIITICSIFLTPLAAKAHPPNITYTDIAVEKDINFDPRIVTSINWIAVFAVFDDKAEEFSLDYMKDNFEKIGNYVKQHLIFYNNGVACDLVFDEEKSMATTEQMIIDMYFLGNINCKNKPLEQVAIKNDLFIEIDPTQNNIVSMYIRLGEGKVDQLQSKTLTPQETEFYYNLATGSAEAGEIPITKAEFQPPNYKSKKLVGNINNLISSLSYKSFALIVLISVVVGALHALEGGHSKLILSSIMVNKNASLKTGFLYTIIFTLTHISDILIVGLLLLLINSFKNIYEIASQIQVFAIYGMLSVASFQFLREISFFAKKLYLKSHLHKNSLHGHHHSHSHNYPHNHSPDHGHDHPEISDNYTTRDKLLLAFFEGLLPCVTGWTLLLLIIGSGKLWLIFPVITSFALGVFIVLVTLMFFVYKVRIKIEGKVARFSEYSSLISSVLLLITSIYIAVIVL